MPQYKLVYFNARGRAELTRWIFAYGGIDYTDERVEMQDWPQRKADIPGGKLPVLMVDGKPLPQSLAIARYAAKQVGLVPADDLHAAYCDAVVDTISEMMTEVHKNLYKQPEDVQKKKFTEELFPNLISPFLSRLNRRLQDRDWFCGAEISWADLLIGLALEGLRKQNPKVLDEFPTVRKLVEKVLALPAIAAWNSKQPDLPF